MTDDLREDECRLHVVSLSEAHDPALLAAYEALLSPAEITRWKQFRFERNQHEYLVTRALARISLGTYAHVEPRSLVFGAGPWGKPFVEAPAVARSLSFNVSNTNGMVVCLVARNRDVGVDVERADRPANTVGVADRFFAPSEVAALHRQPIHHRTERFFSYWTLKEAYIKARGMGLALPLDRFSFELDSHAPPSLSFEAPIDDDPASWQISFASLSHVHRVAWAIRRQGTDLPLTIIYGPPIPR